MKELPNIPDGHEADITIAPDGTVTIKLRRSLAPIVPIPFAPIAPVPAVPIIPTEWPCHRDYSAPLVIRDPMPWERIDITC